MTILGSSDFNITNKILKLALPNGRVLSCSTPAVMGILNVTPDSFFPGSRRSGVEAAVERGLLLAAAGADIVDIGGESTRPGSDPVDADSEIARVVPVIAGIRAQSDVPISIDTQKAPVADAALDAGADLVNDVSALRNDPELGAVVARRRVPVVLMHMRGTPKTMQKEPHYDKVLPEVRAEIEGFVDAALQQGIPAEQIIVDPGIGFGKRHEDNLALIRGLPELASLGFPLLLGASRKSFIGRMLETGGNPRPVEDRLAGTLAVHLFASLLGADILRVHDVRETRDALRVFSTLLDEDTE